MILLKNENHYFIIELPLDVEIWQSDIIEKRLNCGRTIYNALLGKVLKRYNEMIKTKKYRKLFDSLNSEKGHDKNIWKQINELTTKNKLTKFDIIKEVKEMQHHFKCHLHSQICQEIAERVWKAISSILHKPSRKVRFKKFGQFTSLSGKQNNTAIIFKNDYVEWTGLMLKIKYSNNIKSIDYYETYLFPNLDRLKYCKIVRKEIRGKLRYYVQLVFQGESVKSRYKLGFGRVGIDIGTSTIAISSDSAVELLELAKQSQRYENNIKELQRKIDRSRRKMNPNKYNDDGTIKKGNNDKWVKSKTCKRYEQELREFYRKQKVARVLSHNNLTNYILTLGNEFFIETMNFSALAKRSRKPTERRKDGKCKRKKRFGKSVCNRAPSMCLSILERKLTYFHITLNRINTKKCKTSQFNHITGEFIPKPLGKRWTELGKIKVQRDMYSAFLISNVSDNLDFIDKTRCDDGFDNFFKLHDKKINDLKKEKELTGCKFLSSMGI